MCQCGQGWLAPGDWGGGAGLGGVGAAPVLAGEHPLAVLALVGLLATPAAEPLRLELVAQALIERGPHGAARVLLVAPQVRLGLEELVAGVTAERGLLC